MRTRAVWSVFVVMLLVVLAVAQGQEQYLDIFIVQVKPEKRADFDAISKKMRSSTVRTAATSGSRWRPTTDR